MRKISLYLARHYLFNLIVFMAVILAIVFIFDALEILRRAKEDNVTFPTIAVMALTKLPEVGQLIMPFGVFFSAMFTFWQLNRRQELVILRSTGMSVWQFLTPLLVVAVLVGVLQIMIINPLGSVMLKQYESLEQKYLQRSNKIVASLSNGVWLRQSQQDRESIIYSKRITPGEWRFYDMTIFRFDENDTFVERIDSPSGRLGEQGWKLDEAIIHDMTQKTTRHTNYVMRTNLTPEDIQNSFASVQSRSFWELPELIRHLSEAGFETTRLRIHLHSLLSLPALFAAMVALAAVISLQANLRSGGTMRMVLSGILTGFILFFFISYLKAMGSSSQIPVLLAAWSPAFITLLIGLGALLNTEEG